MSNATTASAYPFVRRRIGRAPSPPTWACYEQIPYDDDYSDSGSEDISCSEDDEDYGRIVHRNSDVSDGDRHGVHEREEHAGRPDGDMELDESDEALSEQKIAELKSNAKGKQRAIDPAISISQSTWPYIRMPSHRRRSYSRDRSRTPPSDRDRSRSRSPERKIALPGGADPISESDYFLKNDEFREWLKEEKNKYMTELSSEKSRKYFRKFVKAWNRGKLPRHIYSGVDAPSASSQTGYRWSFASTASKADSAALRAARDEVGAATHNRTSSSTGSGRLQGPTLPTAADLTLARETADEHRSAERDYKRKRDRKEAKERLEEVVGPKPVGREGMLEKKRAQRENDRAFRERGDEGLELDESTLMGGGSSFKDELARRDAARRRFEEKRHGVREDRVAAARERTDAIRQKDKATMDMFMQMAKEKFG